VTKPVFGAGANAPELAAAYVRNIRDIVKAMDVSDAKMERGNVRCDANVSLRPKGQEKLGTRTETKNVNSIRSVENAVRYEIQRQAHILAGGGSITQETRHWHEDRGYTSAVDPSRTPMTTATSPNQTWFRSSQRKAGSKKFVSRSQKTPSSAASA
jgi:aspartyl-tRNA(Asn)/glutamyl-tRNA(Gln) amidotransferase subunit B